MTRSLHGTITWPAPRLCSAARSDFDSSYPEGPHKLEHDLVANPLLELDALAMLGEVLPPESVEYNRGDLPIGVDGKPAGNGLTIGADDPQDRHLQQLGGAEEYRAEKALCRAAA